MGCEAVKTLNVPDHWTEKKIENVALRLYDVIHCLGPRITYEDWKAKFGRGAPEDAARRKWERWKRDIRDIDGCEVKLFHDAESTTGLVLGIRFESIAYAHEIIEGLVGPQFFDDEWGPSGLPTLNVYDLFPECSHDEVDEFLDVMEQELMADQAQAEAA